MRSVALIIITALTACSAGKQTLGYLLDGERDASTASEGALDFSADTHLPWYGGPAYHARWPNGLSASVSFVPIGVWMQSPENAERYRDVGINLFVGLWEGPTDVQLDLLGESNVTTFCGQAGVWQSRLDD